MRANGNVIVCNDFRRLLAFPLRGRWREAPDEVVHLFLSRRAGTKGSPRHIACEAHIALRPAQYIACVAQFTPASAGVVTICNVVRRLLAFPLRGRWREAPDEVVHLFLSRRAGTKGSPRHIACEAHIALRPAQYIACVAQFTPASAGVVTICNVVRRLLAFPLRGRWREATDEVFRCSFHAALSGVSRCEATHRNVFSLLTTPIFGYIIYT